MNSIVNVNPNILGGTPVFRGTRVPIEALFDYLRNGKTTCDFLEDFPSVRSEQVDSLLSEAHARTVPQVASS